MKTVYLAVCLENAIHMVCWTILAILFDKWWIALFAVLMMSTVKKHKDESKEEAKEV